MSGGLEMNSKPRDKRGQTLQAGQVASYHCRFDQGIVRDLDSFHS
jgi:hypothetical protein